MLVAAHELCERVEVTFLRAREQGSVVHRTIVRAANRPERDGIQPDVVSDCEGTRRRLSDHLEGELTLRESQSVASHLARCPDCGPVFASLARAVAALRALGTAAVPSDSVAQAVIDRIDTHSFRRAIALCLEPASLRRTGAVALVVGTVLTSVNQLDALLAGAATWLTGMKIALNFLVPFVVSNLGLLAARSSRRMAR